MKMSWLENHLPANHSSIGFVSMRTACWDKDLSVHGLSVR